MVLMLFVWVLVAVAVAVVLGAAVRIADAREHRDLYLEDVLGVARRSTRQERVTADH